MQKKECGLKEADDSNAGTFTNFSQNDQALYALHTYMMYLKFGFGRAIRDSARLIQNSIISKDEGYYLIKKFDGEFPRKYLKNVKILIKSYH